MNIELSKHASLRLQQRGIPPLILEWLAQYGSVKYDHRGAEVLYFDKRSRKSLAKAVGEEVVKKLASLLDAYAVVSQSGSFVTAGHRTKRLNNH